MAVLRRSPDDVDLSHMMREVKFGMMVCLPSRNDDKCFFEVEWRAGFVV